MTNKNYFLSLCDKELSISGFSVFISEAVPSIRPHSFTLRVYKGSTNIFFGFIDITRRSILLTLSYSLSTSCKFSPYELREWSPAAFLPYTNHIDFMKFFELSLEIFKSKNSKLV